MPVLAIPYLVPFAEAAGIAIGVVASAAGLMELSNRVQAYMESHPEECKASEQWRKRVK